MNWQLRGGRHMYARRGGAWLTADFVDAAVGNEAKVAKPQAEPHLENVPPERILHSMLMLDQRERIRNDKKVLFWAVDRFEGYAGPKPGNLLQIQTVEKDDPNASIVLLDDAGNGFRDARNAFPAALQKGQQPLVIYKVRRPLGRGELWKRLEAFHLNRTIAMLSADELRGEGASISRRLSWERSATDLVLSIARDPQLSGLRNCPFLIVPLGVEGVLLMRCFNREVSSAHLWYEPRLTEGELQRTKKGDMSGFGSAFSAAVLAALIKERSSWQDHETTERALRAGISHGLGVMRNLLEEAFGPCENGPPRYPLAEIFRNQNSHTSSLCDVSLPALPPSRLEQKITEYRNWRILESKRKKAFADLATDVVRQGVKKVFQDVPVGRFGKLETVDRSEIESYRSIRNLIREFLDKPDPERPLCLAVFGPPGGGKSFGVTQVAQSVAGEGQIEKLDFNVSQWDDPKYLAQALHHVRDHALRGKVPLVFFDEFDSQFGEQKLGWLKNFLAPMQDGVFTDGLSTHQVGKAIFVFAGGTASTFANFRQKAESVEQEIVPEKQKSTQLSLSGNLRDQEDVKSVKLPDFLSRLRGYVDVFGLDPPVGTNLLRRAFILRSSIRKKFPTLLDAAGAVRIDNGVLRAFLQVPRYLHGARSLEAILDMSQLVGRTHFDPSLLPPERQLNLHVNGQVFMQIVQQHQTLGDRLEQIAEEIHKIYLKEELAKGAKLNSRPALKEWKDLGEIYRNSNREQAANYSNLTAAAGCEVVVGSNDSKFKFSPEEIDKLARMEHDRWVEERRIKQPDHPDLRKWEELSKEEKDKDIRTVKAIPNILEKVGLRVVRL
jgi:hypothetical protein